MKDHLTAGKGKLTGSHQFDGAQSRAQKLNWDIPRHKEFLKRIEQSKSVGAVIFLGDPITRGWGRPKSLGRNTSVPSKQ